MRLGVQGMIISTFLIFFTYSPASSCNVCHSKNPQIVKMHSALRFKDCFNCHGPGKKTSSQDQQTQMVTDPLCIDCHKK